MKTCPACHKESSSDTECTNCGVYFAKWEKLHGGDAAVPEGAQISSAVSSSPAPAQEKKSNMLRVGIGAVLLIGAGWFFRGGSSEKMVRRAYFDFNGALGVGDVARVKELVSGRYADEFNEPGADIKLNMMKAFQPANVKIADVRVTGNEAIVWSEGVRDGAPVKGTMNLVKEGGGWKVVRHEWAFEISAPGQTAESAEPAAAEAGQAESVPVMTGQPAQQVPVGAATGRVPSGGKALGEYETMPVEEMLSALKADPFKRYLVFDAMIARGEREQLVNALNEMLRDKSGNTSADGNVKTLLKKAAAPVTFDWDMDAQRPFPEDKYSLVEWEIEMRGDSIVSTGKVYVGREIADGFTRTQTGEFRVPTYAKCELALSGPGLPRPVVKLLEFPPSAGEQLWSGVTLASGLAPGEYTVRIWLNAQTVQASGVPLSLNLNPPPLAVQKD